MEVDNNLLIVLTERIQGCMGTFERSCCLLHCQNVKAIQDYQNNNPKNVGQIISKNGTKTRKCHHTLNEILQARSR